MKLIPNLKLCDLDGEPIMTPNVRAQRALIKAAADEKRQITQYEVDSLVENLTVALCVYNSLYGTHKEDEHQTAEEKVQRFDVGLRFYQARNSAEPIEMTKDEISLISKYVSKSYNVMISGTMKQILEGVIPDYFQVTKG